MPRKQSATTQLNQYMTTQNLALVGGAIALLAILLFVYFSMSGSTATHPLTTSFTLPTGCKEAVASYTEQYTKTNSHQGEAIKAGDIVTTHYIGTLEDGTVFDTSIKEVAQACDVYNEQRDYTGGLEFTVNAGQMIPGFDTAIVGMKVGEAKRAKLAPADAYGEYDPKNVQEVPRDQLPPKEDASAYEVGESLFTMYGEFKIASISGDMISVDTNHQLAGKTLYFDIFPLTINQE